MNRTCLIVTLLLLTLTLLAPVARATEQFAEATGHDCSYCHLDPAGGGELTAAGSAYLEQLQQSGAVATPGTASKLFHLLVGYLHILFAVLWFGTILYVHIVLKPAYAVQGLPRGEKLVGIISFWVVGLTGIVLACYRLSSWEALTGTRFGILLLVKVSLYLLMLVSAVLVIKVIGPRLKRGKGREYVPGEPFTAETLGGFDGKEGRRCYFAYNGKVYDASDSRMWRDGVHMQRHQAGTDLTEALSLAPHAAEVMERLPQVGDFRAGGAGPAPEARLFYLIAYMNLGIVFIILFILALWRWW